MIESLPRTRVAWNCCSTSTESDAQVVEELFLSSIARSPTSAEKDVALTAMARDRKKGGEDLQWALLNLSEFLYNF